MNVTPGTPETSRPVIDYAICGGICKSAVYSIADIWSVKPGVSNKGLWHGATTPDLSLIRSDRRRDVTDGCSKTYLVGEKAMYASRYNGEDWGDYCNNIFGPGVFIYCATRWALQSPERDPFQPESLQNSYWDWRDPIGNSFGGGAPFTWNAVFCDGSVHSLSYNMSLATHQALATRAGGDSPDEKEY